MTVLFARWGSRRAGEESIRYSMEKTCVSVLIIAIAIAAIQEVVRSELTCG
jgi:hypothetical protein